MSAKKLTLRSVACEIAKELAKADGGFPSKYMKEAWEKARERHPELIKPKAEKKPKPEPLPELEFAFYSVKYKTLKGVHTRAIVPAKSFEEACKKFYDPNDDNGPKMEILDCSKSRKIPKDWTIQFRRKNGLANATLPREVSVDKNRRITAFLRGTAVEVILSDVLGANPPKKAAVMK